MPQDRPVIACNLAEPILATVKGAMVTSWDHPRCGDGQEMVPLLIRSLGGG